MIEPCGKMLESCETSDLHNKGPWQLVHWKERNQIIIHPFMW